MTPSRRETLQWFTGGAAALLQACKGPPHDEVFTRARALAGQPGEVVRYATSRVQDGWAFGMLARVVDGRPIAIEGLKSHPASLGGTSPRDQASVLSLYDPFRARFPLLDGQAATVAAARADLLAAMGPRGRGTAILIEPTCSPLRLSLLDKVRERFPALSVFTEAPVEGPAGVHGRRVISVPVPTECDRMVLLDANPLGEGPAHLAVSRGWARARSRGLRMWAIEAAPTLSGANADARLAVRPSRVGGVVAGLARELAPELAAALPPDLLAPEEHAFVTRLLDAVRGKRTAFVAGEHQPAWVHGVAALLSTPGTVALYPDLRLEAVGVDVLGRAIDAGAVQTLLVLGGDPVATSPLHHRLAERLAKVPRLVYAGGWFGATAALAGTCIPLAHDLERWGDARAYEGTIALLQPTVRPLHGSPSLDAVLAWLAGVPAPGLDALRALHALGPNDEALSVGIVRGSGSEPLDLPPDPERIAALCAAAPRATSAPLEVVVRPAPYGGPGEAANPWLQELPDPLTQLTWGNAAVLSPKTAADLGVGQGDVLAIAIPGREPVPLPVRVLPLAADGTVSTVLGYGLVAPPIAAGVGVDARPLLPATRRDWSRATAHPTGQHVELALAQVQDDRDGYEVALDRAVMDLPDDELQRLREPTPTVYDDPVLPEGTPQWAMVIDLDVCTGCSACVVACQAENNVPTVGPHQVAVGRRMHWLRIDRYLDGARTTFQPMLCQHCERAPCEYVCPVFATTHSPDGLNEQTYNRCIGTRFCANNCPYEVRRFNWFDYAQGMPELRLNPEVSVRPRGVMEKCTFCVQRIRNRPVDQPTDTVETACQQACPTRAITFGDLTTDGPIRRLADDERAYHELHHLGTQPRVTYLVARGPEEEE